ncbi:MAG: 2-phosphosulfolactate phosphatase [Gemmatimonadetes bacterium]|nr:2-phosphosulfolactate phosphatase [Gemmatimonadota bacterium]
MRLDVFLTPGEVTPGEIAGRTVIVLDVLRATSTIVEALAAGAKAIYPVASIEDAIRLANSLGREEVLLCGERRCLPIEGFDLGNSPREFTPDRVAGKTLVMSTTNGTHAMMLAAGASRVLIGSLLNLDAVVEDLATSEAEPAFICAGRERFFAMEDAVCAGAMASRLMESRPGDWALNDGARAAIALQESFGTGEEMFTSIGAGKLLLAAGLEGDLAICADRNRHPLVPVLHERLIVLPVALRPAIERAG